MRNTVLAAAIAFGLCAPRVEAQTTTQLWSELTFDWARSHRLTYELDVEPKVLVSAPEGQPGWVTLDVTPAVEYVVKNWLDVIGQFMIAPTDQTNDFNSLELTTRGGVRVHLLSRDLPTIGDRSLFERPPKRRVVLQDYARVEQRNILYSDDTPTSSTWRFRNRIEFQMPLNHEKMTADNTRYILSDWEWFVPLNDDPKERFANKQRIRAGFGYRRNVKWRYEALYIWDRSLNTTDDAFTTSDNVFSFRVKRVF